MWWNDPELLEQLILKLEHAPGSVDGFEVIQACYTAFNLNQHELGKRLIKLFIAERETTESEFWSIPPGSIGKD